MAKAVIIARLISPSSDLATWNWLRYQTALLELLPVNLSEVGKDAVYEIADKLLIHKSKLETSLRKPENDLFPEETTLFLYELTNTYFEGSCSDNDLAKRGKSKEKRSDCPLVTLALVVDQRGFPLHSQIYGGNQSEPETLSAILKRLYPSNEPDLFGHIRPTIVMDRGIATKDNITLLKEKKYPYIVIERRVVEKDYVEEFTNAKSSFKRVDQRAGADLSQEVTVSVHRSSKEVDRIGIRDVVNQALAIAKNGTSGLHISLDMDAIDPITAPGVGTPVRGGLSYREIHLAMELIAEEGILTSIDISEVNPILDQRNATAELAVELVLSMLGKKIL